MAIDIKTYYHLIYDAGLNSIWYQLKRLDKYPAMRFAILMEQIHCGQLEVNGHVKDGNIDELEFSKDMLSGMYDDLFYDKLRVNPEKEYDFFEIMIKIEAQKCNYIKNSDHFDWEGKISYLNHVLKAIKIRRLLDRQYIEFSNELVSYLTESIAELEQGANDPKLSNTAATINGVQKKKTDLKNDQGKVKDEPTFESFFEDPDLVDPLIDFLHKEQIISEAGKWIGKTKRKTDLIGFIDALELKSIVSFEDSIPIGLAFSKKFHIKMHKRSTYIQTFTREKAKDNYLELLDDFLLDYSRKSHKKIAT